MQWCPSKNGGFYCADPANLIRPAVTDAEFDFDRVNVALQDRDRDSLLRLMQHVLHMRHRCPEFGWGAYRVLPCCPDSVLAHRCEWRGGGVIAAHNLSGQTATSAIPVATGERLIEILGDRPCQEVDDPAQIALAGYGYRWFRLQGNSWRHM